MKKEDVLREINVHNVMNMLVIAEVCNVPLLQSVAVEFFVENAREFMADPRRRQKLEKHPEIDRLVFGAMTAEERHEIFTLRDIERCLEMCSSENDE